MDNILTYLLQVNLLLTIIFVGYQFLLKNLTFYKLNRVYLLVGAMYAFIYPFVSIKSWFQQRVSVILPEISSFVDMSAFQQVEHFFSVYDLLLIVFGLGVLFFISKLVIQLASLFRIHLYSKPSQWRDYLFRNVIFPIAPFSFFNKVYLHQAQHQELELEDIFEHEYIHVKGRHTIDIIMFEILLIGCWYNPFVWLMRKSVRKNLEFLTDQQVLNKGVDRQAYQYSLLHVTKQGASVGLGNQFNFKTLKKRIMMMNKKRSSKLELSKYAFLLPIVILAGASFTVSKAESKIEKAVEVTQETKLMSKNISLNTPDDVGELFKEVFVPKVDSIQQFSDDSVGYLLDEKLVSISELKKINPKDIESIVVNVDNDLTDKYNKNSIVNVKTKVFTGKVGTPSQFKVLLFKDKYTEIGRRKLGIVEGQDSDLGDAVRDTSKQISISADWIRNGNGEKIEPLIIVDGKELPSAFDLNKLNPNDIESMLVLKGEDGTVKYGEKGKEGVIEITTKIRKQSDSKTQKEVIVRGFRVKEANPDQSGKEVIVRGYKKENAVADSKVIDPINVIAYSPAVSKDVDPAPEDGMLAFRKWIGNNYVYPLAAIDAGVKGTIIVSFVVEKDGSLSEIKTVQDIGYGTGEAVVALLKKSPKWKPGTKNEVPVRVKFSMPINLDLAKK